MIIKTSFWRKYDNINYFKVRIFVWIVRSNAEFVIPARHKMLSTLETKLFLLNTRDNAILSHGATIWSISCECNRFCTIVVVLECIQRKSASWLCHLCLSKKLFIENVHGATGNWFRVIVCGTSSGAANTLRCFQLSWGSCSRFNASIVTWLNAEKASGVALLLTSTNTSWSPSIQIQWSALLVAILTVPWGSSCILLISFWVEIVQSIVSAWVTVGTLWLNLSDRSSSTDNLDLTGFKLAFTLFPGSSCKPSGSGCGGVFTGGDTVKAFCF